METLTARWYIPLQGPESELEADFQNQIIFLTKRQQQHHYYSRHEYFRGTVVFVGFYLPSRPCYPSFTRVSQNQVSRENIHLLHPSGERRSDKSVALIS